MKIKNKDLKGFINFLMEIELKGKQSRMRTKFSRLLGEKLSEFDKDKQQLLDDYGKFYDDGTPVTEEQDIKVERNGKIEDDKVIKYLLDDPETHHKEYQELINEEVVIEENETNKDILHGVKDIVLNCELSFSGEQAVEYDKYCDYVEQIAE